MCEMHARMSLSGPHKTSDLASHVDILGSNAEGVRFVSRPDNAQALLKVSTVDTAIKPTNCLFKGIGKKLAMLRSTVQSVVFRLFL